jgi:hypothetical protein
MKPRPATSPTRRFLRGLTNTALGLLLPCQLGLLWVATRDEPVELPAAVGRLLESRGAEAGLRLHARRYLLSPQRTLIAEDVALEVEGLSGEILTADRVEVGLKLTGAQRGLASLRLTEGRLWCPASVAARSQRTLLLDRVRCELVREGRWFAAQVDARAGKIHLHLRGTLPAGLHPTTSDGGASGADATATAWARSLRIAEQAVNLAERSGGGALDLLATGQADGGAELTVESLLGDDWADEHLGLLRVEQPRLEGRVRLGPDGRLGEWSLRATARTIAGQGLAASSARLDVAGAGLEPSRLRGTLRLRDAQGYGLAGAEVRVEAALTAKIPVRATLRTAGSSVDLAWQPSADGGELRCASAKLAVEELRRVPGVREALTNAGIALDGELLLADARLVYASEPWTVRAASGRMAFGGLRTLGLSADAIAPGAGGALVTDFRFEPAAKEFPLVLTNLDLAGVRGEAHCSTRSGGPFRLALRGEIAPASLDGVLGGWWVETWKLFRLGPRPHAVIEVEGCWGVPTATTTRGVVTLRDFTFMRTPFRSVMVDVDAHGQGTRIGLRRLAGGTAPDDGAVDGTVTWDWSKPLAEAGPFIQVAGDLRPWIAATIAGPELGESLKALDLPRTRELSVTVKPTKSGPPEVRASVRCAEPFQAWGIAADRLELTAVSAEQGLAVAADLGLAGGKAHLGLTGELTRAPQVSLRLQGCEPTKLGALLARLESTTPPPPPPARATVARLELTFDGSIDLAHPRLLRGRGTFALDDPELKKVRVLGGISSVLEGLGVEATSYELNQARGSYGCLDGKAYFPDLRLSGPDSQLRLAGEVDLNQSTVHFLGDFSLASRGSFNPLNLLNLNRMLVALTKIRVKGPLSKPETTALPGLKDVVKSKKDNDLGKMPPSLSE